jgi:hypothetical protein
MISMTLGVNEMNVLNWPSAGRLLGAAALCLWGATAAAAPVSCIQGSGVTTVGSATTHDVALKGVDSNACVISDINAQAGPNGTTSGFDNEPAFGTGWSLLTKIDVNGPASPTSAMFNSVTFTSFGFTLAPNKKSGSWSLSTDKAAMFDLVFAMHASDRDGAFLFDSVTTQANTVAPGTWTISWVNGGGNVPDYSNLTLFVRDVETRLTPQAVPEPESVLLVLTALAVVPIVSRRHKAA